MNKKTFKTALIFSTIVFITINIATFFALLVGSAFYHLGIIPEQIVNHRNPMLLTVALAGMSLFIGTAFSKFVFKRMFSIIFDINNATKLIAEGNYDIKIKENSSAKEFNEIAHNFNEMSKQLAATEILRKDFIENVSHEFKTPLTAIQGYATILQSKNLSQEKQMQYVEKIIFNTQRLNRLSGNILLLSRVENQETGIEKKLFCLDEQIRECILIFENEWSNKDINLNIELWDLEISGNKELLALVWENIIGNAIKFTNEKGSIEIKLTKEEGFAKISIGDNGIGMSEEVRKRVFEKFYQGDTSRVTRGNGLGLALVKKIVDLHFGEINVSSTLEKGSVFYIKLPL